MLLDTCEQGLVIVRDNRLLECILVPRFVVFEQDDDDLHEALDADRKVIENLEQVIGVIEFVKRVEPA